MTTPSSDIVERLRECKPRFMAEADVEAVLDAARTEIETLRAERDGLWNLHYGDGTKFDQVKHLFDEVAPGEFQPKDLS